MSHELLFALREDVLFRCFADSTVAFHPDTGDTLVLDNLCGRILQALHESRRPLYPSEIVQRQGDLATPVADQHIAIEERLDALELHDLVRVVVAS